MTAESPHPYAEVPRLPEGDRVDLSTELGANGPLEIEIGPGRGGFILERCREAPESRIVGFEIRRKWASRVDERLAREGYGTRARVFCEDARLALPRLVPTASVDRFFIHFPDPWWKKRHQKRLVVVDPVVEHIVRLLKDEGELFVQTDVAERAEQYEKRLAAFSQLIPAGDEPSSPLVAHSPFKAQSNRERHAGQDGLPVYRLLYRRQAR